MSKIKMSQKTNIEITTEAIKITSSLLNIALVVRGELLEPIAKMTDYLHEFSELMKTVEIEEESK